MGKKHYLTLHLLQSQSVADGLRVASRFIWQRFRAPRPNCLVAFPSTRSGRPVSKQFGPQHYQAFAVVGVPFLARAVAPRFDVGLLRYLAWLPIALGPLFRSNRTI